MRRAFELHIATGTEIHVLAFGQAQGELLDEGGDVGVRLDGALPLLHPEDLFRHLDLHVLLDRGLAGKPPACARLALGEMRFFGRQDGAAALLHHAFALRAGAATTTGGSEKHPLLGQFLQQLAARGHGELVFAVDFDGDVAAGHQPGSGNQDDHREGQHRGGEHSDTKYDFRIHVACASLQLHAGKRHETQRHQADGDESDTQALQAFRHIAVLELFANGGEQRNRQRPGKA